MVTNLIYQADNLDVLPSIQSNSIPLIYIDPPFNTGKVQKRKRKKTKSSGFKDVFEDFEAFIVPRMLHAKRILREDGSLFFHIDYREAHYCKQWLDNIFGRHCFMNEIAWHFDYGARSKKKWSAKHNTIFC